MPLVFLVALERPGFAAEVTLVVLAVLVGNFSSFLVRISACWEELSLSIRVTPSLLSVPPVGRGGTCF